MARKPRIHFPGALYHVIVRGNAGYDIFSNNVDRCRFCFLLQEGIERFGHRIHAFSLLSNHVHLAIQVDEIPLSRIVQNFTFRHSQWINRRKGRIGHVFQGRYHARIVDVEKYLLTLVRYVDLNPVRAGLSKDPGDYYWGSCRAYLGKLEIPWLTTDWILSHFGDEIGRAINSYREFIYDITAENDEDLSEIGSGRIFGDESFMEEVFDRAEKCRGISVSVDDVVAAVCGLYEIPIATIATGGSNRRYAEARAIAAWFVRELSHETMSELGRRLNRDLSTLSVGASRIAAKIGHKTHIDQRIEKIKKMLEI